LVQDIIADSGTPVLSAHDGVAKSAGYSAGYGFYVVVGGRGPASTSSTAHEGTSWQRTGKKVLSGQRLGSVGHTRTDSGGYHLHVGLWKGRWFASGSRTDPS
jgi:murein DD-endopeptidase MepM/ murein hydrolase activator NlpD